MVERKVAVLRRLANSRAETVKFERWLGNGAVSISQLVQAEQERLSALVCGRHIIAIQDTSEINYQRHAGRVKGLGRVGSGESIGFFIHPMLVIDRKTKACIGAADVHIENRLESASAEYKKLPIEEKESYKWIRTAERSKEVLCEAQSITFIGDRENDIYEFFDRIPDERTHFIIRGRGDRSTETGEIISRYLENQEEKTRIKINIPREARREREKREAILEIRYNEVEIKRPGKCTDKKAKRAIKLTLVEAKEIGYAGKEAVHWILLTTHKVDRIEAAKEILECYKARWNVEQVFRTLKSQGIDIESSQVESAEGLMKLAIVGLCAAIQIMQLVLAREGTTEQKTEEVFNKEEQMILETLLNSVEGKREKQKNPHSKGNLGWATWIIARLGGWQGYVKSEGLPGPITIGRGLIRFKGIYDGWKLHKDLCAE